MTPALQQILHEITLRLTKLEKSFLQPEQDCTRSHPHEEMSNKCELRTEIARLTNCLARANAQAEHFEREWYLRGDEIERLKAQPAVAEQHKQEPVAFLANGARFKLTFDAKGRVSSLWHNMQELDGRWVALVAADDDCHLKLTTPPQRKPLDIKTIKRIATYCGEHITDEDVIEITRRVEEEHSIKE